MHPFLQVVHAFARGSFRPLKLPSGKVLMCKKTMPEGDAQTLYQQFVAHNLVVRPSIVCTGAFSDNASRQDGRMGLEGLIEELNEKISCMDMQVCCGSAFSLNNDPACILSTLFSYADQTVSEREGWRPALRSGALGR